MVRIWLAKWVSFFVFAWQLCTQKRNVNSKALLLGLLLSQQPLSRIFHFLLDNVVLLWRRLPRSRHSMWMFESLWIPWLCYRWCLWRHSSNLGYLFFQDITRYTCSTELFVYLALDWRLSKKGKEKAEDDGWHVVIFWGEQSEATCIAKSIHSWKVNIQKQTLSSGP